MAANFSESFSGMLARSTGPTDGFTCRLEIQVPNFAGLDDTGAVSASIIGGSVEWAYLAVSGKVTGGSIDFFRPPAKPGDPQSINYVFRFTAEGAEYLFQGEKRLTVAGFDAAKDLSTVQATIENSMGPVSSGVLSCRLDELLPA